VFQACSPTGNPAKAFIANSFISYLLIRLRGKKMNFKSTIALLFVLTLDFAPSAFAVITSAPIVPATAKIESALNNKRNPDICVDKNGNHYDCP
jgi:hypothetical protein